VDCRSTFCPLQVVDSIPDLHNVPFSLFLLTKSPASEQAVFYPRFPPQGNKPPPFTNVVSSCGSFSSSPYFLPVRFHQPISTPGLVFVASGSLVSRIWMFPANLSFLSCAVLNPGPTQKSCMPSRSTPFHPPPPPGSRIHPPPVSLTFISPTVRFHAPPKPDLRAVTIRFCISSVKYPFAAMHSSFAAIFVCPYTPGGNNFLVNLSPLAPPHLTHMD